MSYFIVIPSYDRAKQLQNKTLTCLHNAGIKKELINVFVVEEEYQEYLDTLNPEYYNNIIVGKFGLVQQREFIAHYYPVNTKIVSLDDDVECVDLSLTEYNCLDEFFEDAFKQCESKGAYIWSVYPVHNPFFRQSKQDVTECLTYCIGAFYGFINRNDDDLKLTLTREGNKEDVERSILYWLKDGIMLRFNKIGFKTKYYGTGGLGGLPERLGKMKSYSILINEKYPELTKIKIRKNGLYEIVFSRKTSALTKPSNNLDIVCLPTIDPLRDDIQDLLYELQNTTITLVSNKMGRARTFGTHRAMTMGMVKQRISRKYELSYSSKKYPKLYEAILRFGKTLDFEFNSIHINHNVVCSRHLDPDNVGKSLLVSFGDYEGCNLIIETEDGLKEYNTNCSPIIFDGTKHYHYNTPFAGTPRTPSSREKSGNKYSLVFFSTFEKVEPKKKNRERSGKP